MPSVPAPVQLYRKLDVEIVGTKHHTLSSEECRTVTFDEVAHETLNNRRNAFHKFLSLAVSLMIVERTRVADRGRYRVATHAPLARLILL